MNELISKIENLRNDEIRQVIEKRMSEFERFRESSDNEVFKELCFCLMTANFNAAKSIIIQKEINDGFLNWEKEKLSEELVRLGHRFPNARAGFIYEAQKYKDSIKQVLDAIENDIEKRAWLVKNIKGLGLKESSNFLRNIGHKDVAIIDFHIIDLLVKEELIERPKTITPKVYIQVENLLRELSGKVNINLGELDLYLWYEETGKVLK